MPRYAAAIVMTLRIIKEIPVRAKDEEKARERVQRMLENTHFGTLSWEVHGDKSPDGWMEEEIDVFMDGIEEES